jgi:hypothetical protein
MIYELSPGFEKNGTPTSLGEKKQEATLRSDVAALAKPTTRGGTRSPLR